jgi:hypothetical protein
MPDWIKWYQESFVPDNPLFIPEADGNAGAYHVFYVLGQHDGMGFTPFAIDDLASEPRGGKDVVPADLPLAKSYATLARLAPVILENQGKGKTAAIVVALGQPPQKVPLGNYVMDVRYPPPFRAPEAGPAPPPTPGQPAEKSGVLFISLGPDEYLIAGSGSATIGFSPNTPGDPTAGIISIEEGTYVNGHWVPGRRLNGDENGSGKNVRLGGRNGVIQRVKLYRFR